MVLLLTHTQRDAEVQAHARKRTRRRYGLIAIFFLCRPNRANCALAAASCCGRWEPRRRRNIRNRIASVGICVESDCIGLACVFTSMDTEVTVTPRNERIANDGAFWGIYRPGICEFRCEGIPRAAPGLVRHQCKMVGVITGRTINTIAIEAEMSNRAFRAPTT